MSFDALSALALLTLNLKVVGNFLLRMHCGRILVIFINILHFSYFGNTSFYQTSLFCAKTLSVQPTKLAAICSFKEVAESVVSARVPRGASQGERLVW